MTNNESLRSQSNGELQGTSTIETPGAAQHETIIVTGIHKLGVVEFIGQDGQQVHSPISMGAVHAVDNMLNRLTLLNAVFGPGQHHTADIASKLDLHRNAIIQMRVWNLPDSILRFVPPENPEERKRQDGLELGHFAVAVRHMTPEEGRHQQETRQANRKSRRRMYERRAKEAEPNKLRLQDFDHAQIRVKDTEYNLPLSSASSIFTARVLKALSQFGPDFPILANVVADAAWSVMGIEERSLLCTPERKRAESIRLTSSNDIHYRTEQLLRTLGKQLGVCRPCGDGRFNLRSPFDVSFCAEQPPVSDDRPLSFIFPPNTPRSDLDALQQPIRADELKQAADLLGELLHPDERQSFQDLPARLDFITSNTGRRALAFVREKLSLEDRMATSGAPPRLARGIAAALEGRYGRQLRQCLKAGQPDVGIDGSGTTWHIIEIADYWRTES